MPAWRATRLDVNGALKTSPRGAVGGRVQSGAHAGRRASRAVVRAGRRHGAVRAEFPQSARDRISVSIASGWCRLRFDARAAATTPQRHRGAASARAGWRQRRAWRAFGVTRDVRHSGRLPRARRRANRRLSGAPGRRASRSSSTPSAPSYFSTVGMRMLAGRAFTRSRFTGVNARGRGEQDAREHVFPGWSGDRQAVRVRPAQRRNRRHRRRRACARREGRGGADGLLSAVAARRVARSLDVRTNGDPRQAIAALRRAVAEAAPDLPIEGVVTMEDRVRRNLSQERLVMLLTSARRARGSRLGPFRLVEREWRGGHWMSRRAILFFAADRVERPAIDSDHGARRTDDGNVHVKAIDALRT